MSSSELPQHLTDEQFSDLLAGESPSRTVEEHLSICEHCRGEMAAVQGSLGNFNVFSFAWAQREATRKVQSPSRWALRVASLPPWGIGLAGAGAALLVAIGLGQPFVREPEPAVTAQIVIPVPSDAEIARDNQLLASIDQELNSEAQLAVPPAELKVSAPRQQRPLEAVVSN